MRAFDQHPTSYAIYDHEARIHSLNHAASRELGHSEEEMLGHFLPELVPGPIFEELDRRVRRVLQTGETQYMEPFVQAPGESRAHAWFLDIYPLKDAAGRVHGVAVSASDYSQQYESRERLALVSEARTVIGTSLDVERTARELAEVAVPRFADVISVDLLEPVIRGDLPGPVLPGPVQLRRAAWRSASPGPWDRGGPGEISRHPISSPVARCLADGRAVLHHVTDPEIIRWFADDVVHAQQARSCRLHSLIAVPIRTRDAILGAVLFARCAPSRELFRPDDLPVTEDLVARVAVCVDNARRFTRERGIALALQRSLLPRGPTAHPAVETAARYLPAGDGAEAGGDWYDVIPLPGARVGLVVGDVVGHGVHASATMGRLRTGVRTLADIDLPPDELLTHLDDIVAHAAGDQEADTADEIPGDVGATCLYAVYNPVSGTCSLARAGHPAPLLIRPDGVNADLDAPAGPPSAWAVSPLRRRSSLCRKAACWPCSPTVFSRPTAGTSMKVSPRFGTLWPGPPPHWRRWPTPSWTHCAKGRAPTTSPCSWYAPGSSTGTTSPPGTSQRPCRGGPGTERRLRVARCLGARGGGVRHGAGGQ
ncbi:SpoIIE family protein phosphatase [Streptomyces tuirus]|uniref:SpoIIE family protein phosphatase n=1 Tax=Streptomyces tuirus TaxID=68278 RepID=A0A941IZY3_9ACTN|nr:SpoIIE family protein phosphatase [Streptomyces tuirus]